MLSFERLRAALTYEPSAGVFTWNVTHGKCRAGAVAGHLDKSEGYWRIGIEGRQYKAHHLAWLYVTGSWPAASIDHRNRNRADNRWNNLRAATRSQNGMNSARRDSETGVRGVYRRADRGGRFQAKVKKDGRLRHIGVFESIEEAERAAIGARRQLFGEFAPAD